MCRLMAYASIEDTTLPTLLGEKLAGFRELSRIHKDSWGISWNSAGDTKTIRRVESASDSSDFSRILSESPASAGLLHLREASRGISICEENAHPFSLDGISFIHNGTIFPHDALLEVIPDELMESRVGSTDSELFFLHAINNIRKSNLIDGVKNTINDLRSNYQYSGINSIFLNSDYLVVVCEFNEADDHNVKTPGYYELRFQGDESSLVVASSGWEQSGWELIPNHHMLVVDRKTLYKRILPL